MFTGNTDLLNVKRYRNPNTDGKWRWVLFDMDWAFYTDTNSITRWLTPGGMGTNKFTDNTLFIACMKNATFRDKFLTYIGEHMATTYSSEAVVGKIRERYSVLLPLLPDQLERWNKTMSSYNSALKAFVTYAEERPMKLIGYFQGDKTLKLTDAQMQKYFGAAMEAAQNYSR